MTKVRLGDVMEISSGGTPRRSKREYYNNGNIPWIKTGELKGKYLHTSSEYITELGLKNSSAKLFPKGTVLVAMYGATIGACSILKIDASTNQACAALLPNENISSNYIYYYFVAFRDQIISKGVGGAQPNISATILKSLKIPLPPLPIQEKIASILDDAAALRDKTEQLLTEYDLLAQSIFLEMFGDPVINPKEWDLKDISSFLYPISKINKDFEINKINYIDISSINNEANQVESYTTYFINDRPSRAQQILEKNDILFSTVRPNLKNIAINRIKGAIGSTGFFVFRPKNQLNRYFLFMLLKSESITNYFVNLTAGANYPAIRNSDIRKLKIIYPPLDLQNQFAEKVQLIERQKEIVRRELKESEDLFQALLQQAFKGELV